MTAKSIIAVEVLHSTFTFRSHTLWRCGSCTRLIASFSSTRFLQILEENCVAQPRLFVAVACQAARNMDSCLRIKRITGMIRKYKKK